nr:MAG TPA: hypothetical protein [Caudoviricetes sp.]
MAVMAMLPTRCRATGQAKPLLIRFCTPVYGCNGYTAVEGVTQRERQNRF